MGITGTRRAVLALLVAALLVCGALLPGRAAAASAAAAPAAQACSGTPYTVQAGDTLYRIAARYGTTVRAILDCNGLPNQHRIFTGQQIIIPSGGSVPPVPPPTETYYVVQPGDNLYRIALRFGTTVAAIMAANGLANEHRIFVGQRLLIPSGGGGTPPPCRCHRVAAGETVYSISRRYGLSPASIITANALRHPYRIYVGQYLVIP